MNFITRHPATNMDALEPKTPMYTHIKIRWHKNRYRVWQKL